MPEQPIPEQDPIVTKSYALHYVIAMVILMASLFWALWDEAFGQRPWKTFQSEWKQRYSAFLNTAESASAKSEKDVERNPEYQQLEQAYQQAYQAAKPRRDELQKQITELSAKILAVQNVFTDRRAYVNALTYEMETDTTVSGKQGKQNEIKEYKAKLATVEYPNGSKAKYNFQQLEETYNELKDERTKLNAELGEVLKPVTQASTRMSALVLARYSMVSGTLGFLSQRLRKTTRWVSSAGLQARGPSPAETATTASTQATAAIAART